MWENSYKKQTPPKNRGPPPPPIQMGGQTDGRQWQQQYPSAWIRLRGKNFMNGLLRLRLLILCNSKKRKKICENV